MGSKPLKYVTQAVIVAEIANIIPKIHDVNDGFLDLYMRSVNH